MEADFQSLFGKPLILQVDGSKLLVDPDYFQPPSKITASMGKLVCLSRFHGGESVWINSDCIISISESKYL